MTSVLNRLFGRKKRKRRTVVLRPYGKLYNLQEIYEELNNEYFDAKLDLRISWFGNGVSVPKTRMLFGSYNHQTKLIKINRLLDRASVPEYFVRYIIYHEMLHDLLPPIRQKNGRRSIHHKEFNAREKQFPDYALAQEFLKKWKKRAIDVS